MTHPNYGRTRRTAAIDGPTPEELQEAFAALLDGGAREVPDVSAIETLQAAGISFPVTVYNRRILKAEITRGDPTHGALSSYDHVSSYEVEYDSECPEDNCYSEVTRYRYSAHHNIAGSESTFCPRCETTHESESWG